MISCRRTEIRSAHLALKGRPTVGDKGLKTPSSADNRLIDTMQTAREGSEIFIRKPEVRDPLVAILPHTLQVLLTVLAERDQLW